MILAAFNKVINESVGSIKEYTIEGEVPNGTKFDLNGKTISNLTIDLSKVKVGANIKLTGLLKGGSVTELTIIDKKGVTLDIDSVSIKNVTIK